MNIHTLVLLKNKAQLSPGSPSSLPLVWSSLACTTESAPGRASEESGQEGKSSQFHQDIDQDLHFGWRSLLTSQVPPLGQLELLLHEVQPGAS